MMENLGKEVAVIKTVFVRKVNVAVAVFLFFLNLQGLLSVLLGGAYPQQVATSVALLAAVAIYGIFAVNSFVDKIILYEHGIVLKNLFAERTIHNDDIKHVVFMRADLKKMVMHVALESGRHVKINTAKYMDWQPVVAHLHPFKKETPRQMD